MTITDFHITYQIPLKLIKYAIRVGMLYINNDHLIEDANLRRFLAHSELFTAGRTKEDDDTFWKRCTLVYEDKNYRIYDHRKKTTRNYYTVFTKGGMIETFSSLVMAKKWAKARYAVKVKKHKRYHLALTMEQMDYLINSGAIEKRPDIIKLVKHYYDRLIERLKIIKEDENGI